MTKEDFINQYVFNATMMGLPVTATVDGCKYDAESEYDEPSVEMIATVCNCGESQCEGWAMVPVTTRGEFNARTTQ